MPNFCSYDLKAVSKNKESLERLLKIMNYKDPEYFVRRCFQACGDGGVYEDGDYYVIDIFGNVAWSCNSWFEHEEHTSQVSDKDGMDPHGSGDDYLGPAHYVTLDILCERLDIGIECWGQELGCCFQEYYLVNHKGEVVCNDCMEYTEIWEDWNGEKLEEPEKVGGFEEYCEFSFPEEIYGE